MAAQTTVDILIEFRYKLQMLGIPLEDASIIVADNLDMVVNTTLPSSQLKKKHQACNYHRVREAIAARYIAFGHIDMKFNLADICTKPLPGPTFHSLLVDYLFRKPDSLKDITGR